MQVNVFGDSGSKIHALLRRLVWLQENQPEIKSLVSPVRLFYHFTHHTTLVLDFQAKVAI